MAEEVPLNSLNAVSPIDGRYRRSTKVLSNYFSEGALMKYRVRVEVEYLIALLKQLEKPLPEGAEESLRSLVSDFSDESAETIKKTEKVTNHDIKAVEYFIKEKMDDLGLSEFKEWVHFALTSQDINNTSIPLLLKESLKEWYYPTLTTFISTLQERLKEWDVPILAKTHGQPASPTNMAKEIQVFVERLNRQLDLLKLVPHSCKFGGATGNLNAHIAAFPKINWKEFSEKFTKDQLGLVRQQWTTQIEHYDNMGAIFDGIKRINTILIDFARDIWSYVSMEYFKQKIIAGEVGSSAMPHKVNPIDFENAEGNLGVANAIFEHLSQKLPISRLQRDLTDSTVLRNIGVPLGHVAIALSSLTRGLGKLILSPDAINRDLNDNWAVVAEAIQNVLRREAYEKPYEALKELTRKNEKVTQASLAEFIDTLKVSDEVKAELKQFTPFNYVGYGFNA